MDIRIIDKKSHIIYFNTSNGFFEREKLNDSYNSTSPDLLDISITNKCELGCAFCYKKSNSKGKHMQLSKFKDIIDEAKKINVIQIALGGGNPNEHPQFTEFLEYASVNGIVVNYTTNGYNLTSEILSASKKYCGAVAVSMYDDFDHFEKTILKFHQFDLKTNVHLIIRNIDIDVLKKKLIFLAKIKEHINAIIFLNYKPIDAHEIIDKIDYNKFAEIINLSKLLGFDKMGFDSCLSSFVAKYFGYENYIACDSGLYSAYISETGIMKPCSFLDDSYGVDIFTGNILDAWNSIEFDSFRKISINPACLKCDLVKWCNGGCKIFNINNCF